jgi:predicted phosphodiesterase
MSDIHHESALGLLRRAIVRFAGETHISDGETLSRIAGQLGTHLIEPVRQPSDRMAEIFDEEFSRLRLDDDNGECVRRECRLLLAGFGAGSRGGEHATDLMMLVALDLAPPPPCPAVAICSDVHLGTSSAEASSFHDWLRQSQARALVLLGDILDLWIFGAGDDSDRLLERVAASWDSLYRAVSAAKERDREICLVPGNHDGFVYFIEAAENDPWAGAVLSHCSELQKLRQMTQHQRLASVCEIHYPCLSIKDGGRTAVLTHGHYAGWGWRLMVGLEESIEFLPPQLAMTAVALAHKNARLLRRLNNERDWLMRVHGVEDTAIAITNGLLLAYDGAREMLEREDASGLVALLDRAMALYFGSTRSISIEEELRIRDSFLALHRSRAHHTENDLLKVREDHTKLLGGRRGDNVTLYPTPGGIRLRKTPLSEFSRFDELIVGHYHSPRDIEGVHDVGGFVGGIRSSILIMSNGEVSRA